jgi:hypothetical protein
VSRPAPVEAENESWKGLLFSNLLVAAMAVYLGWQLSDLLWPYWIQSVVIGLYAARRILALKRFDVTDFKINNKPAEENDRTRRSTAIFFVFHYGIFHAVYFGFLAARWPDQQTWLWIAAAGLPFLVQQHMAYNQTIDVIRAGRPNIGTLMFLPYARVIPMHVTILFGATSADQHSGLWIGLFTLMKTAADLVMNAVENRVLARAAARRPELSSDR